MKRVDALVVGGGPAGAAAACELALRGRDTLLVERSAGPHHKVCGEFLSVETQAYLKRLGADAVTLGAIPVETVSICADDRVAPATLPFRALSLSRYALDAALLRRAAELGVSVQRGVSVRRVEWAGCSWIAICDDGAAIACERLVLATGKVGLRGIEDARDGSMVGLKVHLSVSADLQQELALRVELFLFGRSYAGLELVEGGNVNLCCLVERNVARRVGTDWNRLRVFLSIANDRLGMRLARAEPMWDRVLTVTCPQDGYLNRGGGEGLYRVGDRVAHIPPFTGDGLAIALGTGLLAAECIAGGRGAAEYAGAACRLAGRPVWFAGLISRLAECPTVRRAMIGTASRIPALTATIARGTRLRDRQSRLTGKSRFDWRSAGLPSHR
jgi:flavin-dependent dehydrogenase